MNKPTSKQLRVSGPSLDLALDPQTGVHSTSYLNEQITSLQLAVPTSPDSPGVRFSPSVEESIEGLRSDISGLTHLMDLQQTALLLIFANKGHEGEKALKMLSRATDALVKSRRGPPEPKKGGLSKLMDAVREREMAEPRNPEGDRPSDIDRTTHQKER